MHTENKTENGAVPLSEPGESGEPGNHNRPAATAPGAMTTFLHVGRLFARRVRDAVCLSISSSTPPTHFFPSPVYDSRSLPLLPLPVRFFIVPACSIFTSTGSAWWVGHSDGRRLGCLWT